VSERCRGSVCTRWAHNSYTFEKIFFSRVRNSWRKFMKNTSKHAQRRDKSIATTFIVETHRIGSYHQKMFLPEMMLYGKDLKVFEDFRSPRKVFDDNF